jgi:hypothetical protein
MYPSPLFLHYLREGNYPKFFASDSEAPEATARQEDRHKTEEVTERTYSTSVSPPEAKSQGAEKPRKRKHAEEDEESLGTSKAADLHQPETAALSASPIAVNLYDFAMSGC